MNVIQKRILAIFVPILVFAVFYGVAGTMLDKNCPYPETGKKNGSSPYTSCEYYAITNPGAIKDVKAFDFEKTYVIWGLALLGIFLFEFELFEDKKNKSK